VAAAATCLRALYALALWLVSAWLAEAARFGLAAGVAVGTKFSAVPFIGLALPALALTRAATAWRQAPGAGPRAWLVGLTLAGLAALLPLALAYRSEEHTSELQSRGHLVCRLLLEKKKKKTAYHDMTEL